MSMSMDPDNARVLQSLEQGTEGFNSVFERLDGVSQEDDFIRFTQDEIRSMMGEDSSYRERLSASD